MQEWLLQLKEALRQQTADADCAAVAYCVDVRLSDTLHGDECDAVQLVFEHRSGEALDAFPPDTAAPERLSFITSMIDELQSRPGVRAVAATTSVPMRRSVSRVPAGDVRSLMMTQSLGMSPTGIAVGLAAAAASTRLLAGWLYGVTPLDLPTFAACGLAMLLVSLVASYLPVRRASRVDPVVALRGDLT